MRPAAWVSASMIHVDMTGYGLYGSQPFAAAIQRDPAAPGTDFTQEPAYAQVRFAATDPKIVVRPGPDYAGGLQSVIVYTLEKNIYGAVDFATGLTELPPLADRPAAPGEVPTAALFTHLSPAVWMGTVSHTPVTVLDARESSGTSLSYSWDLDGNGSYGDDARGGWGIDAPTGTAYVPLAAVSAAELRGTLEVGVRVTTPSGGEATKRITIPVRREGAGGGYAFLAGATERIQPEHGSLPTDRSVPGAMHFACLDIGDDGSWDQAPIETFPVFGSPGLYSFAGNWAVSMPPGRTRVAVAYYSEVLPTPDCTRTDAIQSTSRFLVQRDAAGAISGGTGPSQLQRAGTGQAPAARTRAYRATARLSVRGGRVLSVGSFTAATFTWRGIVSAGRFAFPAPVVARGTRRPAAMDAFAAGTFAMRADTTIGSAPRAKAPAVAVGTSTILLRGARGALACFRITRTARATTWTLTGGTGAVRRLDVTLTGAPTTIKALQAMERRGVIRPSGARYAVQASARTAARGLPADCRALRGRLPAGR